MSSSRIIHPRLQLATIKAAVWLLSVTLGVAAQAAPRQTRDSEEECRPSMTRQLDGLYKDLGLDAAQDAQWQQALKTTESLHQEMVDARHGKAEDAREALGGPAPDLRALTARMDKARDEQIAKRKVAREAWLKFYDGLKPEQKEKASHFLLHQIAMLGDFAPGMMRPRHGDGHHPDGPPPGRGPGSRS